MKKPPRPSNFFIESVLNDPTPTKTSPSVDVHSGLYHTASIVHKLPGRHTSSTSALLQPLITKKKQLVQFQESLAEEGSPGSPPSKIQKAFFQSESTISLRKVPISKADGELLIFKEVFVQPRRDILDQVKTKLALHRDEVLRRNPRLNNLITRSQSVPAVTQPPPSKVKTDRSYLNQQIQVQPPEGLNASVAAPLTPGGGWAPSIPAGSGFAKSNLKDMTMRATAGVQAGDVQKEAHMAYCLGVLNEQKGSFKDAGRFYKRFFFCARMLDDPIGAALGLNRLGVIYFNQQKFEKSLKFHLKHCEFSDVDNKFAAYYNLGLCHRAMGLYVESINQFSQALTWAVERQDVESQCIAFGQLGATYLGSMQKQEAYRYFQMSLELAQKLRNERLQLDALLSLGFLAFSLKDGSAPTSFFSSCIPVCKTLSELTLAEQACCNVGISKGEEQFFAVREGIITAISALE